MNRSKLILKNIFAKNPVQVKEHVDTILYNNIGNLIESKRLQLTAEMFDNGEMSTRQIRESVIAQRSEARRQVLMALSEEVNN